MHFPLRRSYSRASAALVLVGLLSASGLRAQVTPPAGYIYAPQVLQSLTQSCIAVGRGGTFVGIGQGFTANGQAIVLARESGALSLVALGFNSIADCAYDGARDVLYVTDNAGELPGTTTGDTVFAIPSASTATGLPATTIELLPADSIPNAMSLAVDSTGHVLVSDSTGGVSGTVQSVDVVGKTATLFAGGFAFTGGLAIDPGTGDVLVAESLASFEAQISRFDSAGGSLVGFAGPSFGFGSFDLAFNTDGSLLATGIFGGDVVSLDTSGTPVPFASGFTFANGVSVNGFTGRIEVLSSTFSGAEEDRSIHRFTPVDRLVPGNGAAASECAHEFYGLELIAPGRGKKARKAICVDGAPCDADGTANDRCLFPAGFCLEIADPRLPACTPSPVVDFSVTTKPVSLAVAATATAVQDALPVSAPSCFFSDGIEVPVKVRPRGKAKGRATLKVKATRANGSKDSDTVTLLCESA
jgi:hypothetical protein